MIGSSRLDDTGHAVPKTGEASDTSRQPPTYLVRQRTHRPGARSPPPRGLRMGGVLFRRHGASSVSLSVPSTGTVGAAVPNTATAHKLTNPVYQVRVHSRTGS